MNVKLILSLGVASVALSTLAANPQPSKAPRPLTQEELAEAKRLDEEDVARTMGGYIARPGSQKGEIAFVNCQKRVPKAWIDQVIDYFGVETRFKLVYREGAFDFGSPKVEGNLSLFIVEDAKLPALLLAPENRWAMVNVAVIARELRPAFFEARVKKQLARTFALLCGASNSQYPNSLTRGIVDESELDKNIDYRLPMDVMMRFKRYLEPLGVTPMLRVTYRKACRQGWAPAPTNDVQKAIWDKIHELPKNPMKIKFDPNKGR